MFWHQLGTKRERGVIEPNLECDLRLTPGRSILAIKGHQYRATHYQTVLKRHGGGAQHESLKNELVRHRQFQNEAEA